MVNFNHLEPAKYTRPVTHGEALIELRPLGGRHFGIGQR